MFSTKIRATIATLAVALTVASGPGVLAPVAQGQVFRPDIMQKKKKVCDNFQAQYEANVAGAVQIDGNPDGANPSDSEAAASDQMANQALSDAKKAGCGWAA